MKLSRRRLFTVMAKRVISITYLLRDEFTTDTSAPLASPRAAEPGPGTLTLVQNDGQISISDKIALFPAQATPAWTDQGAYSSTGLARREGLAYLSSVKFNTSSTGFLGQLKGSPVISFNYTGAGFYKDTFGVQPAVASKLYRIDLSVIQENLLASILRSTGAYFCIDDKLVFVDDADTQATVYPVLTNYSNALGIDYIRVVDIPAPFNVTNGLALSFTASPTDGATVTGSADGLIYFKWTPATNEILNIRFRRVDDDNCMIVRCNQAASTIAIIRRYGGVETVVSSTATTWTASTAYRIYVRYAGDRTWAGKVLDSTTLALTNRIDGFQFNKTGVKVDGFTTGANLEIYPYRLTGTAIAVLKQYTNPYAQGYRTQNVVSVADGGNITSAIATLRRGDILSLATNGTYNISAGQGAIVSLPTGYLDYPTEIRGNGATIVGGRYGIFISDTENFKVFDLNFLNQTEYCHHVLRCRNFEFNNCTFRSTVSAIFADSTHFDKCVNFTVVDCTAGPSTGVSSCDGFECYGECINGTFTNCVATGVVHGFETWTGSAPNWINANIRYVNCESHHNVVGFSAEGGAQALPHESIVCDGCSSHDNTQYGYQGVEGSTLYRQNGSTAANNTLGETNGSVTDL